ncbi:MAG: hypothetical protein QOJ38_219, partial [Solirubrobacterales bacterium]|nr:hypothetical protein [Solirubrobacterales bacterium]
MLLIGALAGIARADDPVPVPPDPTGGAAPAAVDPNPCPTVNQTAGTTSCDTQVTPIAKDGGGLFTQVGGAKFNETRAISGSFTPITVDFYAVRFFDQNNGFAGGAACRDPETAFAGLDACERVPVIWQYTDRAGEGPLWREVYRGESKGFVGAIAYYARGQALAVGGTGKYPYREFSRDTTSDPDSDPSGKGRVWETSPARFQDSDWHEYGADQKPTTPNLPADPAPVDVKGPAGLANAVATPMRALTALDCSQLEEFCVTGGIQQLFMWHKGVLDKSYGNGSPEPAFATSFRFRVRQLRFLPGDTRGAGKVSVAGVTSGCCDLNPANNRPRLLIWDNSRWYVTGLDSTDPTGDLLPQSSADSFYSLTVNPSKLASILVSDGGLSKPAEPSSRVAGRFRLDTTNATGGLNCAIAAIGFAIDPGMHCSDVPSAIVGLELSDTRLVAGDGDVTRPPLSSTSFNGTAIGWKANSGSTPGIPSGPDGFMDWAVGERRSTGQGLAFTTTISPTVAHAPSPLDCPTPIPDQSCQAAGPEEIQRRLKSEGLFTLPSYGLNGLSTIGATGIGWAVGDKGALIRMGGSGDDSAVLGEPSPPRTGPAKPGPAPASGAYEDSRRAPTDSPGHTPSLDASIEPKGQPEIVPWGSPQTFRHVELLRDDVATVVASRDGAEAWALGSGLDPAGITQKDGRTTLYHYTASKWTVCDPLGIPEELSPDPACGGLAPLLHYMDRGNAAPVRLISAARVPLESDSDPSNDDEFEVVAVGTYYVPPNAQDQIPRPAVIVYRNGRWSTDVKAMREIWPKENSQTDLISLSFSSPEDGWLTDDYGRLYHFDGSNWRVCNLSNAQKVACGDDPNASVLPDGTPTGSQAPPSKTRLLTVGTRTYLYGNGRRGSDIYYPIILYKDPGQPWTAGSGDGNGSGYDPGCASHDAAGACVVAAGAKRGAVDALTVTQNGDGSHTGWASGVVFSEVAHTPTVPGAGGAVASDGLLGTQQALLLHLGRGSDGQGDAWRPWNVDDASASYPERLSSSTNVDPQLMAMPGVDGEGAAFLLPSAHDDKSYGPMLWFNPRHSRWEVFPTPFRLSLSAGFSDEGAGARGRILAPDGQGGAWMVVRRFGGDGGAAHPRANSSSTFFYRYTTQVPKPLFTDAPTPVENAEIVGAAGDGGGGFWLATRSSVLYRYDRVTGWDRLTVPGWDAGRVITRASSANAIAFGPGRQGLLVGEGGRIADLTPEVAVLNRATGRSCGRGDPPPCGTGRDLTSAAIAPDGSALVGGNARTILWRPAAGAFRSIDKPPAALSATITSISMPTPDRAWLATDHGEVFVGDRSGDRWQWRVENDTTEGGLLNTSLDARSGEAGEEAPFNAIAVDRDGSGFAVGDNGLILQRSGG